MRLPGHLTFPSFAEEKGPEAAPQTDSDFCTANEYYETRCFVPMQAFLYGFSCAFKFVALVCYVPPVSFLSLFLCISRYLTSIF
jgi:hypothetical protein